MMSPSWTSTQGPTMLQVLLVALVGLVFPWQPPGALACSGRTLLNGTSGDISDGQSDYPPSAHCEWLIQAPDNAGPYISLDFTNMNTECSYDYLFVYDGDSYDSPLLASFSGSTLPDKLLASSGSMLIYFFSDRNYVLSGFDATYTVSRCPHNCSGQGMCDPATSLCTCHSGYTGPACDVGFCPSLCGDHGTCSFINQKCHCTDGYAGYGCSLSSNSSHGQRSWYEIAPQGVGFTARAGHDMVFIEKWWSIYVFGGNTHNEILDSLDRYDMAQNTWSTITKTTLWPSARHSHKMVVYMNDFYMFGGILRDGSHSNELWLFQVSTEQWHLMATSSSITPPGIASHTLTLVEDTMLYVFGGRTSQGEFLSDMYRIDASDPSSWEKVISRGGKAADRRLVGHSTIYHKESKSLLIFGGFLPDYARFPRRISALHAYHIIENYWSQLYYEENEAPSQPRDRAYHTAVQMGNYMVIYGGNYHIHHEEEICYDNKLYFYHLGCQTWVEQTKITEGFPVTSGYSELTYPGRFSHAAAAAFGDTLLVVGGYRGNMLGDVIAFKVPTSIATNKYDSSVTPQAHCSQYTSYTPCKNDPECAWCRGPIYGTTGSVCIPQTDIPLCEGSYSKGYCPGICEALRDCGSCVVQGSGAQLQGSSLVGLTHNQHCSWCAKEGICQALGDPLGFCDPQEETISGMVAWWGVNSSQPTSLTQCRLEDMPAGLHWLKFRYPPDWNQPDQVQLVQESSLNFQYDAVFDLENVANTEFTAQFRGFIYPLGAVSSNGPPLKLQLISVAADMEFFLSTDETEENAESVAKLNMDSYGNVQALRPDGNPQVFPHEERGYKYYMMQVAKQPISGRDSTQMASTMQLDWTGALRDPNRIRQKFTPEFLEPFNGGHCPAYNNCMACMTDIGCGWCAGSATCMYRSVTTGSASQCAVVGDAPHLLTVPSECPVCQDHVSCLSCSQDVFCEWLVEEARCTRRGRFPTIAIIDPVQCPSPCQARINCSSCLSERNECAWCEETQTCFAFMEYMMRFAFGGCTHWLDNMGSTQLQCHDCTAHTTCKSCLADFQCGWCGNDDNPTIGRCLHGDFTGPVMSGTCSALVADIHNVSASEPATWAYGHCMDVEECRLGLHDCHENATCENTFDSFTCTCNQGFTGNGKDTCNRTCYYDCVHGTCSGPPDFQCLCDVGWTGVECNTDCGCHGHSTCQSGVGICDECQHYTTGNNCEFCTPGAHGDATAAGCVPCQCNGHADESLGFCDSVTGHCYCKDNTEGEQCHRCDEGYYGDPRNNAKCYLRCGGKMILGSITEGALGSHAGTGVENKAHAYCLWILTVHPDLTVLHSSENVPVITFTMETDIKTECSRDYVYVYDGIPDFMTSGSSSSAMLLAAFCGFDYSEPRSVQAKSGYMTVYFEGSIDSTSTSTQGFNASYTVYQCPDDCVGVNHACVDGKCVCAPGYSGIDCSIELCPANCSTHLGQGTCDQFYGQCECADGFGGENCSQALPSDGSAVYTVVEDPWRVMGIGAFNSTLAHMGHSMIQCGDNTIYMFGGYSLSRGLVNDLWMFDVVTETWTQLETTQDTPSPRYYHAAVCVPALHAMYIYGGLLESGEAVKEMWKFNLDSERWSNLAIEDTDWEYQIPGMAGHTMTRVDDIRIWLVGGFSTENYFTDAVYQYDTSSNEWTELQLTGAQPTGLFAHSAVYHESSKALYVFGGYEYQTDKTTASDNLYALDTESRSWSVLPAEVGNKPSERFFHAAVTTDEYMVVLGGRTAQNGMTDTDFDNKVMTYRYRCNYWDDVTVGGANIFGAGIPAVIGGTAAAFPDTDSSYKIYFMGGFDSISQGTMIKLRLPRDMCQVHTDRTACVSSVGCAACDDLETNKTMCYTNEDPFRLDCAHGVQWDYNVGTLCDMRHIEERDCNQHTTCLDCLAEWPAHRGHQKVCQWCSNCPEGKCIPHDGNCNQDNQCGRTQRTITISDECVERYCQASDCDKCTKTDTCIWTMQFKRSSEVARTLSLIPIYDWNCVVQSLLEATPYNIQYSPAMECPARCYTHDNCEDCLNSQGSAGGAQSCVWSVPLQECLDPAYLRLHCSNGECGHILAGQAEECPQPCSIHQQCSQCLAAPSCGWCAVGSLNGQGVCMEGGLVGPHDLHCSQDFFLTHESEHVRNWTIYSSGPPTWAFGQCPPENECTNGHHQCDMSETCTDLPQGYQCDCKEGYIRNVLSGKCQPDCNNRCEPQGVCIAPNVCQCNFGWVGDNCSTECECNQHSNCRSVQEKDVCLECHNNTMGEQCDLCKWQYVGDPRNGGKCDSCLSFCNNHSEFCMYRNDWQYQTIMYSDKVNMSVQPLSHGPQDRDRAICIMCQGNTEGDHCDQCKDGYFRLTEEDKQTFNLKHSCRLCECNGHSDHCDAANGVNCDCKNNTKSPRCEQASSEVQCWEKQCSECIDGFLGSSTDDHQCYRQMIVERDLCLDPTTQMNCHSGPSPLMWGRTVFFGVQPKYLNVDIRITLDITSGGVDLYFSQFDDTYVVDVDWPTGIHDVSIDPKYHYRDITPAEIARHSRSLRRNRRRKRDATNDTTTPSSTEVDPERTYILEEKIARDFNSFITIEHRDTFLIVRDIRDRLVITLPNEIHNLKISRFYLVLLGVGSTTHNETYGNLFFRQDQPHIDLFVFFSVFFSSFFKFLATCVLIWKLKQGVDTRRSRVRRRLEMEHMASRPFSTVQVFLDWSSEEPLVSPPAAPQQHSTKGKRHGMPKLPSRYSLSSVSVEGSICEERATTPTAKSRQCVQALALEPLDDGVAAIATVFFQLPGGNMMTSQACLASTLIQSSRMYPISAHNHHQTQPKNTIHIRPRPTSNA